MAKSIPTLQFANGKMVEIQARLTVGRDQNNDIRLEDASVSSQHALLEHREGRIYLTDLDSTNGTLVNGKRIRHLELKNNDKLNFGVVKSKLTMTTLKAPVVAPKRFGIWFGIIGLIAVMLVVLIVFFEIVIGMTREQAKRATVQVLTCPEPCLGQPSVGSGVLIEMSGQLRILTAWHVIKDYPKAVKVTYNASSVDEKPDTELAVDVVGKDETFDLALLRFKQPFLDTETLKPLTIGDDTTLKTGDPIATTGFPPSVGLGITFLNLTISNINRAKSELIVNQPFAAGNSGGAAIDAVGQLIGIVIRTRENFGVIRSVRAIKQFLSQP